MKRFDGRRPERWIHRPLRRTNRLRLVRVFLGVTLFASTVATPVGVAAAPEVVEAEDVGKTLPASVPSRGTTQVSNQKVSSADGFDCEGDLGGWRYQVIWEKNSLRQVVLHLFDGIGPALIFASGDVDFHVGACFLANRPHFIQSNSSYLGGIFGPVFFVE